MDCCGGLLLSRERADADLEKGLEAMRAYRFECSPRKHAGECLVSEIEDRDISFHWGPTLQAASSPLLDSHVQGKGPRSPMSRNLGITTSIQQARGSV